jgi:hypothetical protein
MNKSPFLLLLVSAIAVAACDDDSDDHGTAPTLESLTVTPELVPAGGQTTLSGTVRFTDPDGDVESLELDLGSPDGAHSSMEIDVANAAGLEMGEVAFTAIVMLPGAGSYPLGAQLVDAEGNVSNTKSTEVVAQ